MKAQRRQELRENDLAHYIQQWVAYVQKNGSRVLTVAVALAVVVVLVWAFVQSRQKDAAEAWAKLSEIQAGDVEAMKRAVSELRALADGASSKSAELMALLRSGECALRLALLTESDAERQQYTDEAALAFERLSSRFADNMLAQGVALCGLATVEENRFALDGDRSRLDKARRLLEQVRDDARFNATPFKTDALARLNTLAEVFTPVTFAPPLPAPAPPPSEEPPATPDGAAETGAETGEDAGATGEAARNDKATGAPAGSGDAPGVTPPPGETPPVTPPPPAGDKPAAPPAGNDNTGG